MVQVAQGSRSSRPAAMTVLLGVNVAVAIASGVFGAVATFRPSVLVGSPVPREPATRFFVQMYALRAVAIAGGMVAASFSVKRAPLVAAAVVAGGGVVQVGDVAIAARFATAGVAGAAAAALVHLSTAGVLLEHVRRSHA